MKIYHLKSKNQGKTSLILVGVHGNEKCGIEAFEKIAPTLSIKNGEVFFIIGNPKAVEKNVRFIDENLNRLFRKEILSENKNTYERTLVPELMKYMQKSDALLDIHASNTPDSEPFIIAESNAKYITKHLPIKIVVSGFDKLEPGGTDGFMNSLGKIGICIECGYTKDQKSTEVAMESIYTFLGLMGHIDTEEKSNEEQVCYQMETLYHTKTDSFKLTKEFKDFEFVEKGTLIGIDGADSILAQKDGFILFARNRDAKGDEAFLFGIKK